FANYSVSFSPGAVLVSLCLMRPPPCSTLFPYTTLFRSVLQRERLLLANTEDNPLVQNITTQIAGVRQDMIANVASTRRQLELAKQGQQQLANRVSSQINQVPTIERGYIDLARLQQIKQAQYIF